MAQINIRVDDSLKNNVERILEDIGIPMSVAITVFLKRIVKENAIPFELTADPFYSDSNVEYLKKKLEKYKNRELKLVEHDLIEE